MDGRKRARVAEGQVKALAQALEIDLAAASDRAASENAEPHFSQQQFFNLQKEMIWLVRWQASEDARTQRGEAEVQRGRAKRAERPFGRERLPAKRVTP